MDTSTLIQLLIGLATAFACVAGTAWIAGKQWQGMSDGMERLDEKLDDLRIDVQNIKDNHLAHLYKAVEEINERLARMEGVMGDKLNLNDKT